MRRTPLPPLSTSPLPPPVPPPFPPHASAPAKPERWTSQAGDAATATLVIPADAQRDRRFEIACAVTVSVPEGTVAPWHQLTVQANGQQQWRRRVASQNPGEWDGLDFRFSHSVPVGEALRITASVTCGGARRRSMLIEADEI